MRAKPFSWMGLVRVSFLVALAAFILAPILVVVAISFNEVSFTRFPPVGFSLRWYAEVLNSPQWRKSFTDSLVIAIIAGVLACILGTAGAIGIHRGRFAGRELLLSFFLSPIILPGLITGLAMLFFFARLGLTGGNAPLIIGHTVITFPYVLRVVLGSLTRDTDVLEEAALTLGADELTTLRRITLPIARPGIMAGSIFAFIISFDNITISIFLSSPRNVTLPIRIFEQIQWAGTPSIAAISSIFVVVTLLMALVIDRVLGIENLAV